MSIPRWIKSNKSWCRTKRFETNGRLLFQSNWLCRESYNGSFWIVHINLFAKSLRKNKKKSKPNSTNISPLYQCEGLLIRFFLFQHVKILFKSHVLDFLNFWRNLHFLFKEIQSGIWDNLCKCQRKFLRTMSLRWLYRIYTFIELYNQCIYLILFDTLHTFSLWNFFEFFGVSNLNFLFSFGLRVRESDV